jgi:hypothetical protein
MDLAIRPSVDGAGARATQDSPVLVRSRHAHVPSRRRLPCDARKARLETIALAIRAAQTGRLLWRPCDRPEPARLGRRSAGGFRPKSERKSETRIWRLSRSTPLC